LSEAKLRRKKGPGMAKKKKRCKNAGPEAWAAGSICWDCIRAELADRSGRYTTSKLAQYMSARANFENVNWGLSDEWLETGFLIGIRCFFGVDLDDNGNLLEDYQQPSFFQSYKSASVN
jgi:hypothetical protein